MKLKIPETKTVLEKYYFRIQATQQNPGQTISNIKNTAKIHIHLINCNYALTNQSITVVPDPRTLQVRKLDDLTPINLTISDFKLNHTRCVIEEAMMYANDKAKLSDQFKNAVGAQGKAEKAASFSFQIKDTFKEATFMVYPQVKIGENTFFLNVIEVNMSCVVDSTEITVPVVRD